MISAKWWVKGAFYALLGGLAGCGTPGPPQPPSLNLPGRVEDLAAVRNGNQVDLTWTMPKHSTDHLMLKNSITAQVCRGESAAKCSPVSNLTLPPAKPGSYTDALPAPLSSGRPRPVSYFVELKNRAGRSAGLSNAAVVLAGQAPAPVGGLSAQVRSTGVVLHWTANDPQDAVRLHRRLLTPPPAQKRESLQAAPPEPLEQNLLVDSDTGQALDKAIQFGNTYEYTAQRVARVEVNGSTFELAGELSAPVRVEAADVFPPAVPAGLAAVATGSENGIPATVDLNWQPDTDSDLAGYFVYRREDDTSWRRLSGEKPVAAPAFHDTDVLPGHTYRYSVSAVDLGGHESDRSAEARETVPQR